MGKLSGYSGLPPAEVIRATVFKNRLPQAKMPLLDRQTYLELKRIGNNINQIKYLEQMGFDNNPILSSGIMTPPTPTAISWH